MPGPTTEVLNDDLKMLRDDFHRFSLEIREDNHRTAMRIAEDVNRQVIEVRVLATKVNLMVGLAGLIVVFVLASAGSSIWWGASIKQRVGELERRFDKIDSRFDRLETSIIKAIEQTRPAKP